MTFMGVQTSKPDVPAKKAPRTKRPSFMGVELQRPPFPPVTPLATIRRAAKIAVEQYVRDLAASK
jgi:hypothetical protein